MSKKLNVEAGDILAIPTTKNEQLGYILARVIQRKQSALIEFFDTFYTNFDIDEKSLSDKVFTKKDRLFPPIRVILLFHDVKGTDKWKIVAHSNTLDVDEAKSGLISLMFSYKNDGRYLEDDIEKIDPPESRTRVAEEEIFWQVEQVMFRIQFYMNGTYKKGEIFEQKKIFADYYQNNRDKFSQMLKNTTEISRKVSLEFNKVSITHD